MQQFSNLPPNKQKTAVLVNCINKYSHAVKSELAVHSESVYRNHQHHYGALHGHHYNNVNKYTNYSNTGCQDKNYQKHFCNMSHLIFNIPYQC